VVHEASAAGEVEARLQITGQQQGLRILMSLSLACMVEQRIISLAG